MFGLDCEKTIKYFEYPCSGKLKRPEDNGKGVGEPGKSTNTRTTTHQINVLLPQFRQRRFKIGVDYMGTNLEAVASSHLSELQIWKVLS